jgi:hypothetical protein
MEVGIVVKIHLPIQQHSYICQNLFSELIFGDSLQDLYPARLEAVLGQ